MQVTWHKADEKPQKAGTYWAILPWAVNPEFFDSLDQMLQEPIIFILANYKDGTWSADAPVKLLQIEIAYWAETFNNFTVGDLLQEVGEDITGGLI